MSRSIRKEINELGYVFLPSYFPGEGTDKIADQLGATLQASRYGTPHELIPKHQTEAGLNTYSGFYGTGVFPLHTDMAHWRCPPHFLLLRCIVGFESVATHILDGSKLLNVADKNLLSRSLVIPRRPHDGKLYLLRLFQSVDREFGLLRWDERFIQPASAMGMKGMRAISEAIQKLVPAIISLQNPGDTLVLDNWRILHGRSQVANRFFSRKLERVYLEDLN